MPKVTQQQVLQLGTDQTGADGHHASHQHLSSDNATPSLATKFTQSEVHCGGSSLSHLFGFLHTFLMDFGSFGFAGACICRSLDAAS